MFSWLSPWNSFSWLANYFILIIAEPRGGSQEDFDSILKGYYDCIRRDKRPALGRKRKVKKVDANHLDGTESTDNSEKGGAAFLAVCRGKVCQLLCRGLL